MKDIIMAKADYPYTVSVAKTSKGWGIDVLFKGETHPLPSKILEQDRLTFYSRTIADDYATKLATSRQHVGAYFPALR